MSKLSRISDSKNAGKVTYEMGVGKPKKGERDCMAVVNLTIGTPLPRAQRRSTGYTHTTNTYPFRVPPKGVSEIIDQLQQLQVEYSLLHSTWIVRVTKGYKAAGLKKGDVILYPTGINTAPLKLVKNKARSEVQEVEVGAGEVFRTLTSADLKDRSEPLPISELKDYYDKLPEAVKTGFADRLFIAHGLPIPGFERITRKATTKEIMETDFQRFNDGFLPGEEPDNFAGYVTNPYKDGEGQPVNTVSTNGEKITGFNVYVY